MEPAWAVRRRNCLKSTLYRVRKSIQGPCLEFTKESLHLRPKFFKRSLALNPDIRPFQSFLFCATSGTLLFTGMKRFLLTAISCFLKKTPDSINTDRQIQRFNDFQTCDIRLFFQKRKDVLMICIGHFWLLSTEIRLSFVAACFVPTLQQTIYRTGVYRKALCQFLYADALIVSFQNQLSSFVVQHSTHLLWLCYITFSQKLKYSLLYYWKLL